MLAAIVTTVGGQIACSVNRAIENPSFSLTMDEAQADLARMRADRVPLERPVVVLAGYRAWPTMVQGVRWRLLPITSGRPEDILPIAYMFRGNIQEIAGLVVDRIDQRWPSDTPGETIEVDVVGVSMGGLVARAAAMPLGELPGGSETRGKRLKIRRLFTMGTPHRGATLAEVIAPDKAATDMKPGSPFLAALNGAYARRDYEVVSYAHLNDTWVGATNSSPPGEDPIWTGGTHVMSHFSITTDDRIMADLARRLRGEPPLGAPSPAPED
jgi:pimeloyl-ACP methyl ester carboxylesterase